MADSPTKSQGINIESTIKEILDSIEREREKEIISRRFGLYDRKETLEQIGELLGVTRERVRQLEKAILSQLKTNAKNGKMIAVDNAQESILDILKVNGHVMSVNQLSDMLSNDDSKIGQSRVMFLAVLSPQLSVLEDNDDYFGSVGIESTFTTKQIKENVSVIIKAIKNLKAPSTIEEVAKVINSDDIPQTRALATTSKKLAHLNSKWGLAKWPTVNPKNIRDKIFVILSDKGSHMHFSEIAEAIKSSDFKRKNVTTQAIHNELIKDKRFVLIGRGIYALNEWGYKKGTVSDIITEVLNEAGEPLHRDEIVKRVLKTRHVKETTILLNLQGKKQFKRVAKATYTIDETAL